jgi:small conductance mechanosensitive channel
MGEFAIDIIISLVSALIIFIAGWWTAKFLRDLLVKLMETRKVDAMLVSFTGNLIYLVLIAFVVIAALNKLGVQTTSIIAILGAAGLAIGLSLQNSLSNFAAGIMIILFRPFKVGDFVEAAGISGFVDGIQMFFTQLKTPDNKTITVPNSSITSSIITNYSAMDKRRVDLVFGISYNDDIRKAKAILQDILDKEERILGDPEPIIAVSGLADSSVNIIMRPWVNTDDYWKVYWDLTEIVKIRFDEEDITIPFPQRDVYLHQVA